MKTFVSIYLDNSLVPDDSLIYNALEYVGYTGFIPKTFIADLLILNKIKLLHGKFPDIDNDYINSLYKLHSFININLWIQDTAQLIKKISQRYDLRTIESFANNGEIILLENIPFSFNYVFDVTNINKNVQKLLNISEAQCQEIEKLPEEVIDILTIANGLGSFFKTSENIIASYKSMLSYGDIVKIHKHKFADPLFNYKLSIKAYDIDTDSVIKKRSNRIVIGYFLGNYKRQGIVNILLKLLGVIVLNNFTDGINIVVYSFLMDTYSKKELHSIEELIQYFSTPKQLKLFLIDNSKSLRTMISENPGDDIIFLPNVLGNCYLNSNESGNNKVNIISVVESSYNQQYSTVCKKTGGMFLTI